MSEIFPPRNPDYQRRVAMVIEYDGSQYYGWQIQKDGVASVQQTLTEAISKVANHPVSLFCAGRTDTGVHASRQVIHFDTDARRKDYGWTVGTNTHLPPTVSVQWAKEMNHDFHARFSALERRYRYVIYNNPIAPGLFRKHLTWHRWPLDAQAMHAAAQAMLGTHDFSTFRASNCQAASPVRTVKSISVQQTGRYIVIDITADGFLYHMVRNLAGALMEIGEGKQPENWISTLLAFQNRNQGAVTALANGLYFVDAIYDAKFEVPQTYLGPHFLMHLQE
jgi:tRNA pseudouridine38-40 synthase